MWLNVKLDGNNDIEEGVATFKASFTGFPSGSRLAGAHINAGAPGTPGPIVVDLPLQPGQVSLPDGAGSLITTVAMSSELTQQFIADASRFYFQVDTVRARGVLQGQFSRVVISYISPQGKKRPRRYIAPTQESL
jgi:hypothetical protein